MTETQNNTSFTQQHVDEVLNSLSSHIAIIDARGVIVAINKSWQVFAKVNGLNAPEFGIGINYIEFSEKEEGSYAEYGRRLSRAIKEVLSDNMKYFSMLYPFHSDDEEQWYKVIVTPLKSERITGAVISHRDISDIVWMGEQLQKSEANYKHLFDQASDGIFISNPNLKFIQVNEVACKQVGYTAKELLNMSIPQLFEEDYLSKDPLQIAELTCGQNVIKERIFKRKDGSTLEVEINSKQLQNGNFQSISRDISDRKRNELLLAKKENFIRTILNTDPECIKLISREGICLSINAAGLAMVDAESEEKVIGKLLLGIIFQKHHEEAMEMVHNAFNGISGTFEYEITTFKGRQLWLEGNTVPFRNTDGVIESCLWISRDVSDRVKDRDALQKSHARLKKNFTKIQNIIEKERKEISRELHDELGQKLTALNLDIAWLQKKIEPKLEEERELMGEMLALVDSLMATVQNISKSLRPPVLEHFNLTDAVDWLLSDFQKRSKINCNVKIDVDGENISEELKVTLFRILQESLTNIIRHSNADIVTINLKQVDGQIKLSIQDNGKGITNENINDLNSFGIHGMQERVESISGVFKITGVPGKGTNILTEIPMKARK